MKKEDKIQIIDSLTEQINASNHFYLTDTSGMDAVATSALRRACFGKQIKMVVVKNTLLTNEWRKGKFEPISEEEYLKTMVKAVKMLPDNISISRITAGISDSTLLAPMWCNDKHRQMYNVKQALLKEGLIY